MKELEYTKEEKDFIKKWGYESDADHDSNRSIVSPVTGKRVSCLDLAKANQRALKKIMTYKRLKNLR